MFDAEQQRRQQQNEEEELRRRQQEDFRRQQQLGVSNQEPRNSTMAFTENLLAVKFSINAIVEFEE